MIHRRAELYCCVHMFAKFRVTPHLLSGLGACHSLGGGENLEALRELKTSWTIQLLRNLGCVSSVRVDMHNVESRTLLRI